MLLITKTAFYETQTIILFGAKSHCGIANLVGFGAMSIRGAGCSKLVAINCHIEVSLEG